jgi:hypothetical protein
MYRYPDEKEVKGYCLLLTGINHIRSNVDFNVEFRGASITRACWNGWLDYFYIFLVLHSFQSAICLQASRTTIHSACKIGVDAIHPCFWELGPGTNQCQPKPVMTALAKLKSHPHLLSTFLRYLSATGRGR